MNILMIGDIVGKPGRTVIEELLPPVKEKYKVDFVLANAENVAGRTGVTPNIAEELFSYGVDLITTGDHVWSKKEILEIIDEEERILRPANYPPDTPGQGSVVLKTSQGVLVGALNLMGRVFLSTLDCPFRVGMKEVEKLREKTPLIIVDIHAEATSEKIALGWYLDGQVSAVIGTHTHVQTADERILPEGTAYLTDVGMAGSCDSVLGIDKKPVIKRFLTQMPIPFEIARDDLQLSAVLVKVDPQSGKSESIKRLQIKL
ncbi:2',3'-cyclic-nucleotide 2'-phosphodiesterase [subsurface metagenome]